MTHSIIQFNNTYYTIEREETESNDEFYFRSWFICNSQPKTKEQMDKSIIESKIMRNKKFMKLQYN